MDRLLSEKKVLNKLGIPDFRHITKDNVINFASMIDKMDPVVAQKALEQFPQFSSTLKDLVGTYGNLLCKVFDDNSKEAQNYYDITIKLINTLSDELDKDNISVEERRFIIEQLLELHNRVDNKDSEDKKFRAIVCSICSMVLVTTIGVLAGTIGGSGRIEKA